VIASIWANLGHCHICTRKAFLAAVTAWGLLGVVSAVAPQPIWLPIISISAGALTLLWIAHILAFARKFSLGIDRKSEAFREERRAVFPIFARAAASAVALSVAPRLAFAQAGQCGPNPLNRCSQGQLCCSRQQPDGRVIYACCSWQSCNQCVF
jgi:hypothetical protein